MYTYIRYNILDYPILGKLLFVTVLSISIAICGLIFDQVRIWVINRIEPRIQFMIIKILKRQSP